MQHISNFLPKEPEINKDNYLSLVIEYLIILQQHLEIAGTQHQREQLESLIGYLNKIN